MELMFSEKEQEGKTKMDEGVGVGESGRGGGVKLHVPGHPQTTNQSLSTKCRLHQYCEVRSTLHKPSEMVKIVSSGLR